MLSMVLCCWQAGLNSTPSVASCGVYGPKLWALSQVESMHLWEWAAATDEEVPGESFKAFWSPCRHLLNNDCSKLSVLSPS